MDDLISRQQAIGALEAYAKKYNAYPIAVYDAVGVLHRVPSVQLGTNCISRQATIEEFGKHCYPVRYNYNSVENGMTITGIKQVINELPPAQPTQLTDDDIETIRVHLSAIKENLCNQHRWNEAKEYEALIDRLTAQPEPHYDEWCTDCKEYDKERHCCPRGNKVIRQTLTNTQPEPCEDAVSRKAAIAQMQGLPKWNGIIADSCVDFEDVISVLENKENLPPVTPKQRTGKWIYQMGMIKCNQCLRAIRRIDHDGLLNFCPNCGKKMEGVSNESN